jgi:hypothetical protein
MNVWGYTSTVSHAFNHLVLINNKNNFARCTPFCGCYENVNGKTLEAPTFVSLQCWTSSVVSGTSMGTKGFLAAVRLYFK